MNKNRALCALLITILTFSIIQIVQADEILPNQGTITSDTTIIVDADKKSTLEHDINVQGTSTQITLLEITNNGELTITAKIQCTQANLTILNKGTLTIQDQKIDLSGNSTLQIINYGSLTINNAKINVLGGVAHINNSGTLNANNWGLTDQFDGTVFTNNKDATLTSTTFTANGAMGIHNILNKGSLQLVHCVINANYGGTVNFNSQYGTLTVEKTNILASGASHGKSSSISILTGQTNWKDTTIRSNSGSIIYNDYGTENTMQNCTFNGIGNYNTNGSETMTDCTITNLNNYYNIGHNTAFINSLLSDINNFNNAGNLTLTNCNVTNIHNLANNGNLDITNTQFNTNANMNILNSKSINADDWMLKTSSTAAKIVFTNGANLVFTTSFIENVDVQTLMNLEAKPTVFDQASGGTITVTNQGTIQNTTKESSFQAPLWIAAVIAAIIITIVTLIAVRRKKNNKHENSA